jgi:hypothetical protein
MTRVIAAPDQLFGSVPAGPATWISAFWPGIG